MWLRIKRFAKITFKEIQNDRVSEGSAALAYYLTLASFPALISIIALIAYLPTESLDKFIFDAIRSNVPGSAGDFFMKTAKEVLDAHRPALLSGGFVAALWASSSGMCSVMNQLNVAYDLKESRGLILQRLVAIGLTLIYVVCLLTGSFLAVKSRGLFSILDLWSESYLLFSYAITAVRYLIAYSILLASLASLYYLAPNTKLPFRFITPGSLVGATLIIVAALSFDYYISNFGSYNKTYGSIGGIIVFMVWVYIASFVILVGAEINAVYEDLANEK